MDLSFPNIVFHLASQYLTTCEKALTAATSKTFATIASSNTCDECDLHAARYYKVTSRQSVCWPCIIIWCHGCQRASGVIETYRCNYCGDSYDICTTCVDCGEDIGRRNHGLCEPCEDELLSLWE